MKKPVNRDLFALKRVRVDDKTFIYIKPGEDEQEAVETFKEMYLNRKVKFF